jgi:hypothetical protein
MIFSLLESQAIFSPLAFAEGLFIFYEIVLIKKKDF